MAQKFLEQTKLNVIIVNLDKSCLRFIGILTHVFSWDARSETTLSLGPGHSRSALWRLHFWWDLTGNVDISTLFTVTLISKF